MHAANEHSQGQVESLQCDSLLSACTDQSLRPWMTLEPTKLQLRGTVIVPPSNCYLFTAFGQLWRPFGLLADSEEDEEEYQ